MTLKSMLEDYTAFNLWANTQIVEWLRPQPAELMEREMPSSFSSIKSTLLHIWSAEDIWLQRLRLITPNAFLSSNFKGTNNDIFVGLLDTSEAFAAFIRGLSDAELDHVCDFKLLNGTPDQRPRAHMVQHCMNHSTYHRGQIITMARNFGLSDPPSTDFIKYIRLQ